MAATRVGLILGDEMPNFEADSTQGKLKLYDFIGEGNWFALFSHPAAFTPVCTTELAILAKMYPEFAKRGVKVAAISCDAVDANKNWEKDVLALPTTAGLGLKDLPYPIIADPSRELAVRLGMLDAVSKDAAGLALTARAVFVIGPDRKLKFSILYPATTGRNFDEVLRAIDSVQRTATVKVATPGNWVQGGECVVASSVSQEDAAKLFPNHKVVELPSGKAYLRMTADPKAA